MIDVDERTIMKIEKGDSNPTLEVFYPLIQVLKIDSREIFNAKLPRDSEAQYQLYLLTENCTEEVPVLIPVVESIKNALNKGNKIEDKKKRACSPRLIGKQALRFPRLAQSLTTIFSFATSISVSFLHLRQ